MALRSAVAFAACAAAAAVAAPSADELAFVSIRSGDAHIYVQRGGIDRVLTLGASVNTQPAWSASGRIAFTSSRNGVPRIYVMNDDGSQQRRLTGDERIEMAASWSPDGRSVAFYSKPLGAGASELRIVEVDSGRTVVVTGNGREKGGAAPTWSADGRRLAFSGRDDANRTQVWAVNSDGSGLLNLSAKAPGRGRGWASIAPDGQQVAFIAGLRTARAVIVADIASGETRTITPDRESFESPRWSPDGRQLLVASNRDDPLESRNDIFVMNADGSAIRNLTRHPGEDFEGQWSADGRSVVFQSLRTGTSQLFRVDLASGQTVRLSNHPSHDMEAVLRPGIQAGH